MAVTRSDEPLRTDSDDGWSEYKSGDFFSVFENLLNMGAANV